MLFLVNKDGVPSVATWVKVGTGTATPPPAVPVATAPATAPAAPVTTTNAPAAPVTPAGPGTGAAVKPATKKPAAQVAGLTLQTLLRATLARQSPRRVAAGGLRVGLSCTRACTVRAEVLLDRKTAVRLRLAGRHTKASTLRVGKGSRRVARGSHGTLVVHLTRAARRAVAKLPSVALRVRFVATAADGTTDEIVRAVRLRR